MKVRGILYKRPILKCFSKCQNPGILHQTLHNSTSIVTEFGEIPLWLPDDAWENKVFSWGSWFHLENNKNNELKRKPEDNFIRVYKKQNKIREFTMYISAATQIRQQSEGDGEIMCCVLICIATACPSDRMGAFKE